MFDTNFDFLAAPNAGMAILRPQLRESRADGPGAWRMIVGSPRARSNARPLDASEQADVAMTALDSLFAFEAGRRGHSRPAGMNSGPDSPLTVRTACIAMTIDGMVVEPTTPARASRAADGPTRSSA